MASHHDFSRLRQICAEAVEQAVVPGLVVAVGDQGDTVFLEGFGQHQIEPPQAAAGASVDTLYDLASLTKALCTSVLAMQAVAGAGGLSLDQPVQRSWPELSGKPLGAVTIRQLLAHTSGLPAHRPLWQTVLFHPASGPGDLPFDRDGMVRAAAGEALEYPPGTRSLYSDLGFILLGAVLGRQAHARLDYLFAHQIARPLGLPTLKFRDLAAPRSPFPAGMVAATERCSARRRMIVGEVHDLNAFAMAGVAGHAGLFGTAGDVAQLAHALLRAFHGISEAGRPALVDRAVIEEFWRGAGVPGSTWCLGWDRPAATGSLAGEKISRQAVGHLGFTGGSLWIDPRAAAFVVMLSNRIHPEVRDDPRFRALRPAVNDAAWAAIGAGAYPAG